MSSKPQNPGSPSANIETVRSVMSAAGYDRVGFARLETPFSIALYQDWLDEGHHGEMHYLERHLEMKREPQKLMEQAVSAIVVAIDYVPHPHPVDGLQMSLKVARYAQGEDYHHFLKRGLARAIEQLQIRWPEHQFLSFTDSAPVLERDLAVRAGLGWIGKNTCLLDRQHGSLCLIAEIYTTLPLTLDGNAALQATATLQVPKDFCGTCTRCLDACPTQALEAPRKLNARKCISYLTIESRAVPPVELRSQIGDQFFGCDICQTVCPWNQKVFGSNLVEEPRTPISIVEELKQLLSMSNRALEKKFLGTPLSRAGSFGLRRNALIVAANLGLRELESEIKSLMLHPKLGELAEWALAEIRSRA